jgi:serine-type D-Ala-D-Ala carboxypeptidase/endopeptidase (penicillin-binding protein 4)
VRALLCALAVLALAACAHGTVEAPQARASAVASPRPTPSPTPPPLDAAQRTRVHAQLDDAFGSPLLSTAGIYVLAPDGSVLFSRNGDAAMTPASTLKLLVGATALEQLGPAHRMETEFESLEPPDADGVVHGPLWLVGSGDPLLRSDDLRNGVAMLVRSGVRKIDGDLVVDASAFHGPEQNPHWDPDDLVYDYAAGTSAISLDGDVAEFRVTPGEPGDPARVDVFPPNPNVTFTGIVLTSGSFDSDVTITRVPGAARNEFTVSGHIAPGGEQSFYEPVAGIPSYVGGAAREMLGARGIVLMGDVQTGVAPFAAHPLWVHRSEPLSALVREMLVFSDNHTAEQLLRTLGYQVHGSGTDGSGLSVENAFLRDSGAAPKALHAYDGSGLSPQDRITPRTLVHILQTALAGPAGETYLRALPLVGVEGTVKRHSVHSALGRARAKTGHIDGVAALAGAVLSRHHGRMLFAYVVNGPAADNGIVDEAIDRALDQLADL